VVIQTRLIRQRKGQRRIQSSQSPLESGPGSILATAYSVVGD
jgi:hypothetical protein